MGFYLIAGAAGYVGSRLAERLLAEGNRVRGLVHSAEDPVVERLAAQGMAVWIGDLTRPETITGITEGIEVVYNLSGGNILAGDNLRRTLLDGNQNLIAACSRSRRVRAYLFASSPATYGDGGEALLDEDTPTTPGYPLGEILCEAEQVVMRAVRDHRFPGIVMRIATIYGPDHDLIDAIANGAYVLYGQGRNFVSHIHVDDLIEALRLLPELGMPGGIYNLCDDDPIRQYNLVAEVRRRLGMLSPRRFDPAVALQSGIDPSVIGMACASTRLSNARLKHDLPFFLRYPSYRLWLDERLPAAFAEPADLELAIGD
ncbi:MAG: NAD-dependent epimerase/dehydratase family protein [Oscillochloris sp.]|nr:NAD-dependent epimerase/dehydratase family protein [Oscillochloris sp.]